MWTASQLGEGTEMEGIASCEFCTNNSRPGGPRPAERHDKSSAATEALSGEEQQELARRMGPRRAWTSLSLKGQRHEVTAVARGQRIEQLQRDRAIVTTAGERAPVQVSAALDTTIARGYRSVRRFGCARQRVDVEAVLLGGTGSGRLHTVMATVRAHTGLRTILYPAGPCCRT